MTGLSNLVKVLIEAQHACRILHWKSAGKGFDTAHKNTDDYVDKLASYIDQAQEICQIYSINPPELCECCSLSENLKVDPTEDYTLDEVYEKLLGIFNEVILAYTKAMQEDIANSIVSELESSQYYFILESMYKVKRTLAK